MNKKLPKTHSLEFKCPLLYADDILEIENIALNASQDIKLSWSDDDYEFNKISEYIEKHKGKSVDKLSLSVWYENTKLLYINLRKGSHVKIEYDYTFDNDIDKNTILIFNRVKELIEKRERKILYNILHSLLYSSLVETIFSTIIVLLIFIFVIIKFKIQNIPTPYVTGIYILGVLICAAVFYKLKKVFAPNVLIMEYYKDKSSFFKRKKDEILIIIISTLFGFILGKL